MEITKILSRSLHRYFDARLGYSSAGCFPALPASAFPSEVDRATGCVATQEGCGLKRLKVTAFASGWIHGIFRQ